MKKTLSLAGALCACAAVYAGGINTNTNQNAAFLRQMSQEAIIDINGLYMNPAGTAFLSEGSHLMICLQNAKQSRDIETVFPLFKYNRNNPTDMHAFKGDAYAPVVPSFMYSHNFDKWSVNASFALIGGGGKCEFDKGLGSFEALYAGNIYKTVVTNLTTALVPVLMQQGLTQEQAMAKGKEMAMQSYQGYSLNAYMKGRQYYFGFTLGANYKVLDNLALGAQLRATYASCNYNGWVEDIHAYYVNPATQQTVDQKIDQELSLNADQKGWGFTPIFSVDWKINEHWNVAAKYEFKTRIRLENKSEMNDYTKAAADPTSPSYQPAIGQFRDGAKIKADMPSFFAVGAQYSPIERLRINAGYHVYGDKNASQYGNKQDLIDDNTWEITSGVEFDIIERLTASVGFQTTQYGFSDANMNDLSFSTSSNSYGCGFRVGLTKHATLDVSYMKTVYKDRTVATQTEAGQKLDTYSRDNRVFGVGVNLTF